MSALFQHEKKSILFGKLKYILGINVSITKQKTETLLKVLISG